jgi:hypothetical protein
MVYIIFVETATGRTTMMTNERIQFASAGATRKPTEPRQSLAIADRQLLTDLDRIQEEADRAEEGAKKQ